MIKLEKIRHEMPFADRVVGFWQCDGMVYEFQDHTGHIHGQYQVGNQIAKPPDGAVGAVRVACVWYWVIAQNLLADEFDDARRMMGL